MQDTGGRISNQQKKSFTHFKKAGAKKRGGRIERYGQRNNKTTNEQKHYKCSSRIKDHDSYILFCPQ